MADSWMSPTSHKNNFQSPYWNLTNINWTLISLVTFQM
jgi:hypothetical protein